MKMEAKTGHFRHGVPYFFVYVRTLRTVLGIFLCIPRVLPILVMGNSKNESADYPLQREKALLFQPTDSDLSWVFHARPLQRLDEAGKVRLHGHRCCYGVFRRCRCCMICSSRYRNSALGTPPSRPRLAGAGNTRADGTLSSKGVRDGFKQESRAFALGAMARGAAGARLLDGTPVWSWFPSREGKQVGPPALGCAARQPG